MESTDAIVLRRLDHRDSDLILTLFSRDRGKIAGVARGARASRKRFGGALGLATVSRFELSRRRGAELWSLRSATPRQAFMGIGHDVVALAHASYAAELVREMMPAEVPDPDVFDLVVELMSLLDAGTVSPHALRAFELRLLDAVGLGPVFDRCASCGAEDAAGDGALARGAVVDPERGGAVCSECAAASRGLGVRPLATPARLALVSAQRAPSLAEAAARPPEDGAAEARDISVRLVLHHIGKPLKSLEFIAKLAKER